MVYLFSWFPYTFEFFAWFMRQGRLPNRYAGEQHLESKDNMSKNIHGSNLAHLTTLKRNGEMQDLLYTESTQKVSPSTDG